MSTLGEGHDMSNPGKDFARYANAERQLCDQAGPVLAAIIRAIEASAGLFITEVRVTVDWERGSDDSISANCTIVHAETAPTLEISSPV